MEALPKVLQEGRFAVKPRADLLRVRPMPSGREGARTVWLRDMYHEKGHNSEHGSDDVNGQRALHRQDVQQQRSQRR